MPQAEPPTHDCFERGDGPYHTYRIPSIVAADNGDLLALCEGRVRAQRRRRHRPLLPPFASDGGRTWGPLTVVWDDGPNTCGNPCPVVDRSTGVLWLLMTHNLGDDTEQEIIAGTQQGTRTVWVTRSRRHGATWSTPARSPPT